MINLLDPNLAEVKKELGFRQIWIENDRNRFGDSRWNGPQVLRAVAYSVEPTVRIFKINTPLPESQVIEWWPVVYWELQYGVTDGRSGEKPYWHKVRTGHHSDPQAAIHAALELPRDREIIPLLPPIIDIVNRRILYSAFQVNEADISRHHCEPIEIDGLPWIAFEVKGSID